ncbi:hypothetical protein GCM10022393_30430 [Aquimarina addita]|uniref:Uncharacterized protein n=1 Tax=Aquimarina addita TaxID=870485 RepID=A0ABP6US51_9FLAO
MAVKEFLHMLFFVTLIALKVSAASIYLHDCHNDEHMDDCELCDHAIHNQNIEFSTPPQFQDFEIDTTPVSYKHENHYEPVYITTTVINLLYGRPPPISSGFIKNPCLES